MLKDEFYRLREQSGRDHRVHFSVARVTQVGVESKQKLW